MSWDRARRNPQRLQRDGAAPCGAACLRDGASAELRHLHVQDDPEGLANQMETDGIEGIQPSKFAEVLQAAAERYGFDVASPNSLSNASDIHQRAVDMSWTSGAGGAGWGTPLPVPQVDRFEICLRCRDYVRVFFTQ